MSRIALDLLSSLYSGVTDASKWMSYFMLHCVRRTTEHGTALLLVYANTLVQKGAHKFKVKLVRQHDAATQTNIFDWTQPDRTNVESDTNANIDAEDAPVEVALRDYYYHRLAQSPQQETFYEMEEPDDGDRESEVLYHGLSWSDYAAIMTDYEENIHVQRGDEDDYEEQWFF